ncbi:aldehyde dehydrogenase family protein [Novipirellula artificiosorum]|uniref:Succinate-semialdehyde dehydrogenase [NADP(+)] n=1 Tax=Novipirellula artificiosorum TaxID=2528016 RepID=A0A5C6E5A9_9BACT|nr:aldehyde dehydrogenase family protein [Novipirellula artificiosorum]TWU42616.1 Succinate-semialdehyde dehydrogenase [NADP(+)] [Novipirellula artificiosorum]
MAAVPPWSVVSARERCRRVASVRSFVTQRMARFVQLASNDQRTNPFETITAELLPLCESLRFLGRTGPKVLKPRVCGLAGRPVWLWGVRSVVRRDPLGTVLIIGTWNYPIFLVGTQVAQALAAGNRVLVKPAEGCETTTAELLRCFHDAGIPTDWLKQLDSPAIEAVKAIESGVDLVILTGSAATGRRVLEQAAATITPTIMELSGCDAMIVLPSADVSRVVDAIDFSIHLNGAATCIGPRRLIVENSPKTRPWLEDLLTQIETRFRRRDLVIHRSARDNVAEAVEGAISSGAVDRVGLFDANRVRTTGQMNAVLLDGVAADAEIASADLFAPILSVIRVDDISNAIGIVNGCRYRLATSIFGSDRDASVMARQLATGSITINDVVFPTADPRVPFGGRGESGFGVTRGVEGLLAMTVPVTVSRRTSRFAPHLRPQDQFDLARMTGLMQCSHAGSVKSRIAGLKQLIWPQ